MDIEILWRAKKKKKIVDFEDKKLISINIYQCLLQFKFAKINI